MIRMERLVAASLVVLFLGSVAVVAHERLVMGTVAAVHDKAIDVKVKENDQEQIVSISLEAGTKYLKDKRKASREDLKVGARVVAKVDHGDDEALVAREIHFAPVAADRGSGTGRP